MPARDPILRPVSIEELRPTQMTVGFREVQEKRRHWRAREETGGGGHYLGTHMIPVLLGPKQRRYVIDHHHLVRALLEEGVDEVLTSVVADLSHLDKAAFWVFADHRGWAHPYDADGVRQPIADLPKRIADLANDPFRSLAGELRRAGGYAKDPTPFAEFLWADFLRRRLARDVVEDDFTGAMRDALQLAKSRDAAYLPGWCGPTQD